MKKLLLGLGTLSLIALPVLTIISCSSTTTPTLETEAKKLVTKATILATGTAADAKTAIEAAAAGTDRETEFNKYYSRIALATGFTYAYTSSKVNTTTDTTLDVTVKISETDNTEKKDVTFAITGFLAAPTLKTEKAKFKTAKTLITNVDSTVAVSAIETPTDNDAKKTALNKYYKTPTLATGFSYVIKSVEVSTKLSTNIDVIVTVTDEKSKVSEDVTFQVTGFKVISTSKLTLKSTPIVTTSIATAGIKGDATIDEKFALFDLIWTGSPDLALNDMGNITITSSATPANGTDTKFTIAGNSSFNLTGELISEDIAPIDSKTSAITLKSTPTVTTSTATAAIADGATGAEKLALFNLLWTSVPPLALVDMANITITASVTPANGTKTTFTVAGNYILILTGSFLTTGDITTTNTATSALTLIIDPIVSWVTATAGVKADATTTEKLALFNLIWTGTPPLALADMANITITAIEDGTDYPNAPKFIITGNSSLVLSGELTTGNITLSDTSDLTLKTTPIVYSVTATAGVAGASNADKWALFDLIWTGNPVLTVHDMLGITINASAAVTAAGTETTFTVTDGPWLVLTGKLTSLSITLS